MKRDKFLAPQSCATCPTRTPSEACFADFNCALYDEHIYSSRKVNVDRVADNATKYNLLDSEIEELVEIMDA